MKVCKECNVTIQSNDYCKLCAPYMETTKESNVKTIKEILSTRMSNEFIQSCKEQLSAAYDEYEPILKEFEDKVEVDTVSLDSISLSCDMFGRAILCEDSRGKRRNPGYSINIDNKMNTYSVTRRTDYSVTGVHESIINEISAEIMYGKTADTGRRSSYYEEGYTPGYIHFVDSHGMDHGLIREGSEASIESAEHTKAHVGAVSHLEYRAKHRTMVLGAAHAYTEKAISFIKGAERNAAATYIKEESYPELLDYIRSTTGRSFILDREAFSLMISTVKKDLWKAYKETFGPSKLETSYNKVLDIVKQAMLNTNIQVAFEDLSYKLEALESVELWSALKYARTSQKPYDYEAYQTIRKVACMKQAS